MHRVSTRVVVSTLFAILAAGPGCDRRDKTEISERSIAELTPAERALETLQGRWIVDVDKSLATAATLSEQQRAVARRMLSSVTLTIDGRRGRVTTDLLGGDASRQSELEIRDAEHSVDSFLICVSVERGGEPKCDEAAWTDLGFRVMLGDGRETFYVADDADSAVDDEADAGP